MNRAGRSPQQGQWLEDAYGPLSGHDPGPEPFRPIGAKRRQVLLTGHPYEQVHGTTLLIEVTCPKTSLLDFAPGGVECAVQSKSVIAAALLVQTVHLLHQVERPGSVSVHT